MGQNLKSLPTKFRKSTSVTQQPKQIPLLFIYIKKFDQFLPGHAQFVYFGIQDSLFFIVL